MSRKKKNQNVPYPQRESTREEEASVLTLHCQPWLFLVASVVLWMAFWVSSVTFPLTCPLYHVHCMHIHIQQQPIACIRQTAVYTVLCEVQSSVGLWLHYNLVVLVAASHRVFIFIGTRSLCRFNQWHMIESGLLTNIYPTLIKHVEGCL